ncbi:cmgc cdk crk7 protein kinase [Ophiostoma piceae UAMH 11346]|uniref:cyclin-dependent kinase n=1 Tax=Ophiostoma piceae (strain UAMH 11346) TaxID=1262450 RepID=S3C1Y5_OPHP1|nr:cmgc cdk crk7 protein kinase [Ophiostoma piceae UAMH 11346]
MPPPSRPPPTGPQSKFSFAFKATSKPTVTAPKAEIAQKLSSVVSRQPQHQQHQQPQDSPLPPSTPSHTGDLQLRPHSSEARHSFPRNAPTEPASSRARSELRQRNAPSGPSGAGGNGPRYRKVKQIIRRPKPRPTLSDDMAASESVYYRKPGNESVVGSGTYGQVFKAVHVYTKQLAALKKIRMDGEREGLPVTAIREIKLLQSLNHVNIVDLLEVMVEDGHCYMVFEYLSHDLNGLLNHPTFKLDAAQKKHMGLQMFQGLDYLHRRGVLHRDIKAANILVSSNGILKIADFGLARFFAKRHQLDYTNRVITIWYRSPELLLGETQYGPAVDIWSAACVLVEIFTRYPIFPGDGGEISQINKIYGLLGTPSKTDWPGLVDMPWFELLRPSHRLPNNFSNFYANKVSPAALSLLIDMFQYDPAKRPSAAQVLEHPYFAQEEPAPRQAIELASIGGDWHEFETKALRRENERKAKEAKEAKGDKDPKTATANPEQNPERKKRPPPPSTDSAGGTGAITAAADDIKQPEAKRQHVERADGPHEQQVGDSKRTADPAGIVNGV